MTEDQVQARIRRYLEGRGFDVYDLAQGFRPGGKRHATTRQTKGLADLFAFGPLGEEWRGAALWIEVKALTEKDLRSSLPLEEPWIDRTTRIHMDGTLRQLLNNPAFYDRAMAAVGPERRLELYRKKRRPEQILFEERCAGRPLLVHVLGGLEETITRLDALAAFCEHVRTVRHLVATESAERYLNEGDTDGRPESAAVTKNAAVDPGQG